MSTTELRLPMKTAARPLPLAARLTTTFASLISMYRVFRNRTEINRLHELDDHQLRDIGLTRSELNRAMLGSSFFDDPSSHLTQSARLRARSTGRDDYRV